MKSENCLRSVLPVELSRCDDAASFLQSGFWGDFKAHFGWSAKSFALQWEGYGETSLLVICRPLGPFLSFAYIPWGPELPPGFPPELRNSAAAELAAALKPLLPKDTAFIRFDPPWYNVDGVQPLEKPFVKSAADVQCPDTVILDLAPGEEQILQAMKPKWRYNIRLAGKKGVEVREAGPEGLPVFYDLLKETARRDGIAVHHIDYYRTLFDLAKKPDQMKIRPDIRLYLASHEGDTLAGIITLFRGSEAVYLYGASSAIKRNLMAPYALQWQAMGGAKKSGCLRYDLFGIPPNDDPHHPMAGLYLFKTGFGGSIIHRSGCYDYIYRPFMTGLFHCAESLRKKIRDLRKIRT
ncbi:hypothetical protein AGMMS49928_21200 [Spirochaetia bacterium]|nr:hypothetical protein AGMMS49928_21200 [Spirochaetia bacterium]